MAAFYAFYPPGGGGGSNASVGANGVTAPTSSTEVAGVGPDGNLHPLVTDNTGILQVSVTANPLQAVNLTQVGSVAITEGQKTMSASLPVAIASDQSAIPSSQSGTWNITNVSGTVSLPTGASTSALQTTGNSSLATIVTNTTNLTVAQGTATSGQPGQLVQGAVTTAAPTYTTGNTNPLSLTVGGALRTDSSGSTQPISGTVTANQGGAPWSQNITQVGGATIALGQAAAASSLPVTLSNENVQDLNVTGQSAQTAVVNNILTVAAGTAATDCNGYRTASVQVVSTATGGTYIFEGSNDNTNFQTIPVWSQLILTGTPIVAAVTPTSSQLVYTFPVITRYVRLRIATTITGGSIQAFSRFSQTTWEPPIRQIAQATAANLNVTATGTVTSNQGTAALVANSWFAKISDGTNGPAAVKAASTASVAADPSLVVQLSPNGSSPKMSGRALANAPTVTTYGTPVTSAAYVTIIASTTSATNLVEIFDSSGVALFFATGAAAAEVNQFVIYPGGNGQVPLAIPAGTRISYKAVSTSATGASAFNVLNLYT